MKVSEIRNITQKTINKILDIDSLSSLFISTPSAFPDFGHDGCCDDAGEDEEGRGNRRFRAEVFNRQHRAEAGVLHPDFN